MMTVSICILGSIPSVRPDACSGADAHACSLLSYVLYSDLQCRSIRKLPRTFTHDVLAQPLGSSCPADRVIVTVYLADCTDCTVQLCVRSGLAAQILHSWHEASRPARERFTTVMRAAGSERLSPVRESRRAVIHKSGHCATSPHEIMP